jgi:hypothetical protein
VCNIYSLHGIILRCIPAPLPAVSSPADLHILRSEESAPDLHLSPSPPDQLSEPETPTTRTIRRPKYGPPRIPTANSLDDVLRYWEDGAPEKGLVVPLANWCINFKPHEYRNETQKYSLMGILRDEFMIHCNGDWDIFESRYSDL